MKTKKNNSFSCSDSQSHSHSQVGYSSSEQKIKNLGKVYEETQPFNEVLKNVKSQIEFKDFNVHIRDAAEHICLIITEVMKLPPNACIRIGGNHLTAETVQAIYQRLTHEHIELVIENFKRATYEIYHKKTYLRTALYNSVFEIDAHFTNAVNKDFPELVNNPFGMRGET